MKKLILLLTLIPLTSLAQTDYITEYNQVEFFIQNDQLDSGYVKLKRLETIIPESDTLYDYTLWYLTGITTYFESESRLNEDFKKSLD